MPFNISILFQIDEGGEGKFKEIGYDLGYDFVEYIAEGNSLELVWSGDIGIFRYESEESGIHGRNNYLVVTRFFENIPYFMFKHILIGMEKIDCEAIWTRGFVLLHSLDGCFYLLKSCMFHEHEIFLYGK